MGRRIRLSSNLSLFLWILQILCKYDIIYYETSSRYSKVYLGGQSMFTTICSLLSFIGSIGVTIGMYKQFIKKEKVISNHILAYSFFISALLYSMEESYIMMIWLEVLAVLSYREYIKEKGAK